MKRGKKCTKKKEKKKNPAKHYLKKNEHCIILIYISTQEHDLWCMSPHIPANHYLLYIYIYILSFSWSHSSSSWGSLWDFKLPL